MNELQTILAETCTRLFTDHATTAVLEGAEKGEWPVALWQALEENGLTLPQVPEAFRDSFLNRNPVNRSLLTAASRAQNRG